ncbi:MULTISPECIES: helix-turn-helix transcriptional regulator [unclassified Gilliamella]|uniref:helix-turn-helix domain-containing protein n=1 Tax=unclassified Gilliamella TaxID=2685620 RepID=UPI0013085FB8|nr:MULTISPECIES: helix-turn-helix transcriptional regulator [unclassified Gilliamella]MWP48291.1 helix-turn-helix domain-containing protein [Gilliamella sp. Lep-s35]MWP68211.1 helix-turn-helix domain-containing protein [Gilliamella sp. Lep-s5]MWP76431.1 helix-turn-helix domain-containing protein [Gilliamella sp. Lep-s21]
MSKKHSTTFSEIKDIALANPAVRAAYDEAEDEWKLRELLLKARKNAKLSQTELAKRLGVASSNINRIEKSPLNTNIKTILKYLNACNAKIDMNLSTL